VRGFGVCRDSGYLGDLGDSRVGRGLAAPASAYLLPDGTVVWNFDAVPHDGTFNGGTDEPLPLYESPGSQISGSLRFPPGPSPGGYLAATLTLESPVLGTVTSASFFGLQPDLINFDFTGKLGDRSS